MAQGDQVNLGPCAECCGGEGLAPCECPCDSVEWAALAASGTPCGGLRQTYTVPKLHYSGNEFGWAYTVNGTTTVTAVSAPGAECTWLTGYLDDNGNIVDIYVQLFVFNDSCYWNFEVESETEEGITNYGWAQWHKTIGSTPVGTYAGLELGPVAANGSAPATVEVR